MKFLSHSMYFEHEKESPQLGKEWSHGIKFKWQFTIKSRHLTKYHLFCNGLISSCIYDVLNNCKDKDLWVNNDCV